MDFLSFQEGIEQGKHMLPVFSSNSSMSFSRLWRFNGKEFDPETGNYYYGQRCYTPKEKSWLSVDRMAAKYPHLSPYVFSENNPINITDPNGDSTYFVNYDMSPQDAETIMSHTRAINEKNGITGLDYKVISPDEAEDLKLIKTDAVISLRGDLNSILGPGNTDGYLFKESQNYESIHNTYVNINEGQYIAPRKESKASYLYAIGYVAAHEIQHQYIAKASMHFWGNHNELGRHDNRTMNLNHAGGSHIPDYSSPYFRAAEKMTPMHQNMIFHFLKQNGVRI